MKIKEKHKQRLMAILFLLFFFMLYQCSGQQRIHRYPNNFNITTFTPEQPMKFDGGGNDTIFLSILADSLGWKEYKYSLYCYFPRAINNFSIELQYINNTSQIFTPERIIDQYAEFKVSDGKLAYLPLSAVIFYNNNVVQSCINVRTRNYFINFYKKMK